MTAPDPFKHPFQVQAFLAQVEAEMPPEALVEVAAQRDLVRRYVEGEQVETVELQVAVTVLVNAFRAWRRT